MTTGLIITAATIAAIVFMGWLFWSAPLGYENEDGWFPGIEPDEHAQDDNLGI
jgi:hypothetical protein